MPSSRAQAHRTVAIENVVDDAVSFLQDSNRSLRQAMDYLDNVLAKKDSQLREMLSLLAISGVPAERVFVVHS